jgi:hypothetical protein
MIDVMPPQGNNKSVSRVAQATVQDEVLLGLDQWTKRTIDIILATGPHSICAHSLIGHDGHKP